MKKKNIIITSILIFTISIILSYIFIVNNNKLIKLSYTELIEKVENKDSFVLCVTATECIHCQEYKPKLKKISNKYDINIYYVNYLFINFL